MKILQAATSSYSKFNTNIDEDLSKNNIARGLSSDETTAIAGKATPQSRVFTTRTASP